MWAGLWDPGQRTQAKEAKQKLEWTWWFHLKLAMYSRYPSRGSQSLVTSYVCPVLWIVRSLNLGHVEYCESEVDKPNSFCHSSLKWSIRSLWPLTLAYSNLKLFCISFLSSFSFIVATWTHHCKYHICVQESTKPTLVHLVSSSMTEAVLLFSYLQHVASQLHLAPVSRSFLLPSWYFFSRFFALFLVFIVAILWYGGSALECKRVEQRQKLAPVNNVIGSNLTSPPGYSTVSALLHPTVICSNAHTHILIKK